MTFQPGDSISYTLLTAQHRVELEHIAFVTDARLLVREKNGRIDRVVSPSQALMLKFTGKANKFHLGCFSRMATNARQFPLQQPHALVGRSILSLRDTADKPAMMQSNHHLRAPR